MAFQQTSKIDWQFDTLYGVSRFPNLFTLQN